MGRGSLTLWLDARSLSAWLGPVPPTRCDRRRTYTDAAILYSLLMRKVYRLPLRATARSAREVIAPQERARVRSGPEFGGRNAAVLQGREVGRGK